MLSLLVVRSKDNMKREVMKSTCDLWWLLTMQLVPAARNGDGLVARKPFT